MHMRLYTHGMRQRSQSISCQPTPPHHNDIQITIITPVYSYTSYTFWPNVLILLSLSTPLCPKTALSRHTVSHSITYRYNYNYKPSHFSHANHWNLQPTTIRRLTLTEHSNNFQLACTRLHSYHVTPLHIFSTIYLYVNIYIYIYIYIRVATPASVLRFTSPNPRVRLITHYRHTLDNMINLLYYYYLVKLI